MFKKIISAGLALSMVFGGAALLPEGFSVQSGIVAQAEEILTYGDYEYELLDDGTVKITNYNGSEPILSVPETINGAIVTCIGFGAFHNCSRVKSIILPDSVRNIYDSAFSSNLENITLPNGIKEIYKDTFGSCESLKSIIIPESVEKIQDRAFCSCESLESIEFGNNVQSIGKYAFQNCISLQSLILPDSIDYIDEGAFASCEKLTTVVLPNKLSFLGFGAFGRCISLESIVIPDSITELEPNLFDTCTSLKNVTLSRNLISLNGNVFKDCTSLENIELPDSVEKLTGNYNFSGCDSLKSITIPASVKYVSDNDLPSVTIYGEKGSYIQEFANYWKVFYNFEYIKHDHVYDPTVTKEPSCIEEGLLTYTCKKCDEEYTETIAKTAHKYIDKIVNPTYDSKGYTEHTCSVCGDSYKDNYTDKLERPHDHSYTSKVTKSATCKEAGVKTYTCSCGETYTESIPKLTTHTFGAWKTTKAATCTAAGTQTRTCSVCGESETKTIAKTAHKYTTKVVAPTHTAQGYTLHTCSVCGDSYKDTYKPILTKASIAKATVIGLSDKTYTGKSIKPTPTVKLGTKTLKAGTDYTVSYKNNKNCGKATVTVTGKGSYTGSVTKTFIIKPKKAAVKKLTSPKTKQLKVTLKKSAGSVTGYQITYSTSKKFADSKTKSVSTTKTSKTIKSLKKGKTYYIKVRAYKTVGSKKYYGKYSDVRKLKIK